MPEATTASDPDPASVKDTTTRRRPAGVRKAAAPPGPKTDADIDAAVEMMRRGARRCRPSSMPAAAK